MKFCQSIPQSRWRGRTLMLLALLLCIALPKTSSAQRVSVVLENVSLAEALKKVSAASGYEFFYNSNVVLKSDKRITASFEGTELKTVLDHVFSGTEFSYRIKNRTIVVVPRPAQPAPEEPAFVEIAGRITDGSNKAPMAGVTVVVEGSTIGTSSDADGRYVLKIPAGIYNIMFSFIGYEIHVKRYNGQNLADFRKISLTPTSVEVADVVVTASTSARRRVSRARRPRSSPRSSRLWVRRASCRASARWTPRSRSPRASSSVPTPTACPISKSAARAA